MIKVLMIDDNISLVNMIKEYFKSSNDVSILFTAHDGEEGIKVIEDKINDYDVIVLDLIMPKKDGIYVLEEMARLKNMDVKELESILDSNTINFFNLD